MEADRGLGSRAERVRCFGLKFVRNIFGPEFDQSRHLAKTKLHPEYPHRKKKRIPPLSRKLVFFANRNTQKNMQLFDKIHTVFTAALRELRSVHEEAYLPNTG